MWLVRRPGEDRETEPLRRSLSQIRVAAMQAQLSANAAWAIFGQTRVERMLQIGMISVQHPSHLAITQDGEVRIAVYHFSTQYFTMERQRCYNITHEQIQRESTQ
jgi:hypothetical protein